MTDAMVTGRNRIVVLAVSAVLGTVVQAVRRLAQAIAPVTPASAAKLIALIDSGHNGQPIEQPVPIFPRLELD